MQVVNEVVVDRGPSPYLCQIDLYVDRQLVTSVQVLLVYHRVVIVLY